MAKQQNKSQSGNSPSAFDLIKDALELPKDAVSQKPKASVQRLKSTGQRKSRVKPSANYKKGKLWWLNPRNWSSAIVWTVIAIVALCYFFFAYFFFIGPSSFRWKGMYGDINYPEGYEICGIDVSHYQGNIDWEKVRNAEVNSNPLQFVFIKATEGVSMIDDYFNDNFYQAKENGLVRGAYHFFSPKSSGKEQAHFFCRQVHLEEGDLPPVLDVESKGDLTPTQLKKEVLDWLNVVEAHYEVKPIIYTGYKFKVDYLNDKIFDPYPYWIAHYYVDKVEYQEAWKFWQYTDRGVVEGIQKEVDLNIYNGSMYDLAKLRIGFEE